MPETPADRRAPKKSIRRVTTSTKSLGRTSARSAAAKSPKSAGPGTKSATPKPRPQDAKGGTTGRAKAVPKNKGASATVRSGSRKAAGSVTPPKRRTDTANSNASRSKLVQSGAPSSKKARVGKAITTEKRRALAIPASKKAATARASGRTVAGSSKGKRTRNSGGKATVPVAERKAKATNVREAFAKNALTKPRATAVAAGKALGAAASSRPGVGRKAVKRASDDTTRRTAVAPPRTTGKRDKSTPGQDRDATRQTENQTTVKKASLELKRSGLTAASPAEAMTAAAMAPLIATASAMRTATMAATTAANAAMTSMSLGAHLLGSGQTPSSEPDATSVAEASAKAEDEEKMPGEAGAVRPEK
jgi:hypothetical protein